MLHLHRLFPWVRRKATRETAPAEPGFTLCAACNCPRYCSQLQVCPAVLDGVAIPGERGSGPHGGQGGKANATGKGSIAIGGKGGNAP